MLKRKNISTFKKMSVTLRDALKAEGVDPAYALILRQPSGDTAEFHLLVSPTGAFDETVLDKPLAQAGDRLQPENDDVLLIKLPDGETALICRKVGSTWIYI